MGIGVEEAASLITLTETFPLCEDNRRYRIESGVLHDFESADQVEIVLLDTRLHEH